MQLEDWELTTKIRRTFVTPEMIKRFHLHKIVFTGRMIGSDEKTDKECFKSEMVKVIHGNKVITEREEFLLGKASRDYQEFCEAVKNNMPIVMNWVIGENALLSANLYENNQISYLCEKVVEQNFENRTLRLKSGKVVYVVWKNINHEFLKRLATMSQWMSLDTFFPRKEFPMQMDVLKATEQIWRANTIPVKLRPYEWVFNSPCNFSILNEEHQSLRGSHNRD